MFPASTRRSSEAASSRLRNEDFGSLQSVRGVAGTSTIGRGIETTGGTDHSQASPPSPSGVGVENIPNLMHTHHSSSTITEESPYFYTRQDESIVQWGDDPDYGHAARPTVMSDDTRTMEDHAIEEVKVPEGEFDGTEEDADDTLGPILGIRRSSFHRTSSFYTSTGTSSPREIPGISRTHSGRTVYVFEEPGKNLKSDEIYRAGTSLATNKSDPSIARGRPPRTRRYYFGFFICGIALCASVFAICKFLIIEKEESSLNIDEPMETDDEEFTSVPQAEDEKPTKSPSGLLPIPSPIPTINYPAPSLGPSTFAQSMSSEAPTSAGADFSPSLATSTPTSNPKPTVAPSMSSGAPTTADADFYPSLASSLPTSNPKPTIASSAFVTNPSITVFPSEAPTPARVKIYSLPPISVRASSSTDVRCGCPFCTSSALEYEPEGISCEDRINFLIHERGYSEQSACHHVAGVEFSVTCQAILCDPEICLRGSAEGADVAPGSLSDIAEEFDTLDVIGEGAHTPESSTLCTSLRPSLPPKHERPSRSASPTHSPTPRPKGRRTSSPTHPLSSRPTRIPKPRPKENNTRQEERDRDEWEDYEWDDLPPKLKNAATNLGWTPELWNDVSGRPHVEDVAWDDLSPKQKNAARAFGYTRERWDREP